MIWGLLLVSVKDTDYYKRIGIALIGSLRWMENIEVKNLVIV